MRHFSSRFGIVLVAGVFITGCGLITGNDDEPNDSGNYTTATLTHDGFDFSANAEGWSEAYDGETIGWQPGAADNPAYPRDVNLWWRPSTGATKDMGAVSMASVTQAPTTWDTSPNIPALLVGHVVVARCADGSVKFRVISVDVNGAMWPVQVEFYYSATATFDH